MAAIKRWKGSVQIGSKFQCRNRSREAGESRRDLRRLGLQAERAKFVPNGCRSVY